MIPFPSRTEKVCSECGIGKPHSEFSKLASGKDGLRPACKACSANRKREWAARNSEKIRSDSRTYYAAHAERERAKSRAWYAANIEKARREAIARRRPPSPEKGRIYGAAYRAAHPDRVSARRALRRGVERAEPVSLAVLVGRDNNRCGICGKVVPVAERSIDHILPISKGGVHSYSNTRLTHLRCNFRRQNRGAAQLRLAGAISQ